jgi:hypothetical protein
MGHTKKKESFLRGDNRGREGERERGREGERERGREDKNKYFFHLVFQIHLGILSKFYWKNNLLDMLRIALWIG